MVAPLVAQSAVGLVGYSVVLMVVNLEVMSLVVMSVDVMVATMAVEWVASMDSSWAVDDNKDNKKNEDIQND